MSMQPEIKIFHKSQFIGKKIKTSFAADKTQELWQSFMPQRNKIKNSTGADLYSIEIYNDTGFFNSFNPNKEFEKWAAVPVSGFDEVPNGMEVLTIPEGLYAVFLYKRKASDAAKVYEYIFKTWLPNSDYKLDNRPHFAVMGEKYKNEDPGSEEEIWIPIKANDTLQSI